MRRCDAYVERDSLWVTLVFAALINEGPMPERGADHLGNNPVGAYWASAASSHAAFARPGFLSAAIQGPWGAPLAPSYCKSGSTISSLTDGTSGRPPEFAPQIPEELAEQALVFVRDQLSTQARTGRFAEPQSVDDTAPAIDRLAGFLGRSLPPRL
jgi:hypothetical protein